MYSVTIRGGHATILQVEKQKLLHIPLLLNVSGEVAALWEIKKKITYSDLWRATGQEDINLEIRKRKFRWIGPTLRKEDGEVPKAALLWNPQGSRKRGRPKISCRRSVTKEVGRSWNELGSWRLIDRSGKNSYTTYVPKGTTHSIIIIIIIITYSESVFVAFGIQHGIRMRHIAICVLFGSTVYFHIFSLNARFSRNVFKIKCGF